MLEKRLLISDWCESATFGGMPGSSDRKSARRILHADFEVYVN